MTVCTKAIITMRIINRVMKRSLFSVVACCWLCCTVVLLPVSGLATSRHGLENRTDSHIIGGRGVVASAQGSSKALDHDDDDGHQLDGMTDLALDDSRRLQTGMQSTLLCRCQAYFENFYKHRRRSSRGLVSQRRRKSVTINYRSIAVDANGYYVVDGLTVLPPSFSTCRKKRRMIETMEEEERIKVKGASDDDASFSALPDEDAYRAMVGRADDDYMKTVIQSSAADDANQFVSIIEPSHERRIKGGAKGPKKANGDVVGGPKKAKAGPSPGWSGGGSKFQMSSSCSLTQIYFMF